MSDLRSIVESVTDLPTLPTVLAKLTRLIADPNSSAADINEALSRDQGLTTKILRIVNSPYYGFPRRISTLTNAVVILGYNKIRNLAMSSFVYKSLNTRITFRKFNIRELWRHCLATAMFSEALVTSSLKIGEDAFICGLLHDFGKGIMGQYARDDLFQVISQTTQKNTLFYQAEKDLLGYNHAEIGAEVAERWNLPKVIVSVLRSHHEPFSLEGEERHLAIVVNFSDILARSLALGHPGDDQIPDLKPEIWEFMGLTWDEVETLMRKVEQELRRTEDFFSR